MSILMQTPPPYPYAGEIASLAAALIWSISITIFSRFAKNVAAYEVNLYRNIIALAGMLIALAIIQPPWPADPKYMLILGISGVIGISIGDTAFFATLKRLGAQITSSTQCLSPGFTALFAVLAYGEKLSLTELIGMTITLTAVMAAIMFNRNDGGSLQRLTKKDLIQGLCYGTISAICQAVALVMTRYALQNTHVLVGATLRMAPATLLLYLGFVVRGEFSPFKDLKKQPFPVFIGIAIAALLGTTVGLTLLAIGSKYTKAGIAAALSSTYPIWIIPVAAFFLGEKAGLKACICTIIAVVGIGLMMVVT